nr:MAG TPA: hypothetical protein [Caudoviricetes sp.]
MLTFCPNFCFPIMQALYMGGGGTSVCIFPQSFFTPCRGIKPYSISIFKP